jgi:hypothetical protein
MTVCVATICDNGKSIILVADKMIGIGFIESEPDINKLLQLHKDWWVLFAGNDISPVFDVIAYARRIIKERQTKAALPSDGSIPLQTVMDAVREKNGWNKPLLYTSLRSDGTSPLSMREVLNDYQTSEKSRPEWPNITSILNC